MSKENKQFIAKQLKRLLNKEELNMLEIERLMTPILNKEIGLSTEYTLGSFLSLLDAKGVTDTDIHGIANSLKNIAEEMPYVSFKNEKTIATVGSGKDEFKTINVTTTASIVASSLGAKVAKVGCGAESSAAGTTDVLTILNYNTNIKYEESLDRFNEFGFGFFNPEFPLKKLFEIYIGRSLIFNPLEFVLPMYLGIKTDGLLYGLANPNTELTGRLLLSNGYNNTLLVCGQSNEGKYFDEISNLGETILTKIDNNKVETYRIRPTDVGIKLGKDANLLQPEEKGKCALVVKDVLQGNGHNEQNDIVAMNAGAILWISGLEEDLEKAIYKSLKQIESGKTWEYFSSMIKI